VAPSNLSRGTPPSPNRREPAADHGSHGAASILNAHYNRNHLAVGRNCADAVFSNRLGANRSLPGHHLHMAGHVALRYRTVPRWSIRFRVLPGTRNASVVWGANPHASARTHTTIGCRSGVGKVVVIDPVRRRPRCVRHSSATFSRQRRRVGVRAVCTDSARGFGDDAFIAATSRMG